MKLLVFQPNMSFHIQTIQVDYSYKPFPNVHSIYSFKCFCSTYNSFHYIRLNLFVSIGKPNEHIVFILRTNPFPWKTSRTKLLLFQIQIPSSVQILYKGLLSKLTEFWRPIKFMSILLNKIFSKITVIFVFEVGTSRYTHYMYRLQK